MRYFKKNKGILIAAIIIFMLLVVAGLRYAGIFEFTIEPTQMQLTPPQSEIILVAQLSDDEKNALAPILEETPGSHYEKTLWYIDYEDYSSYKHYTMVTKESDWFKSNRKYHDYTASYKGYCFGKSINYIENNIKYDAINMGKYNWVGNPGQIPDFYHNYQPNSDGTDSLYEFIFIYRSGYYTSPYGYGCVMNWYGLGQHPDYDYYDSHYQFSATTCGYYCGYNYGDKNYHYVFTYYSGYGKGSYSGNSVFMYKKVLDKVANPEYKLITDSWYTCYDTVSKCKANGVMNYNGYRYECVDSELGRIKKTKLEIITDYPTPSPGYYKFGYDFQVGVILAGYNNCNVTIKLKDQQNNVLATYTGVSNPSNRYITCSNPEVSGQVTIEVTAVGDDGYTETDSETVTFHPPTVTVNIPENLSYKQDFTIDVVVDGVTDFDTYVDLLDETNTVKGSYTGGTSVQITNPTVQGTGFLHVTVKKDTAILSDETYSVYFNIPDLLIVIPDNLQYKKSFEITAKYKDYTNGVITVVIKQNGIEIQGSPWVATGTTIIIDDPEVWGQATIEVTVTAGDLSATKSFTRIFASPSIVVDTNPQTLSYRQDFDVIVNIGDYDGFASVKIYDSNNNFKTGKDQPISGQGEVPISASNLDLSGSIQIETTVTIGRWSDTKTIYRTISPPQLYVEVPSTVMYGEGFTVTASVEGYPSAPITVTLRRDSDNTFIGQYSKVGSSDAINIPPQYVLGTVRVIIESSWGNLKETRYVTFVKPSITVYYTPTTLYYGQTFQVCVNLEGSPANADIKVKLYKAGDPGSAKTYQCSGCSCVEITTPLIKGDAVAEVTVTKGADLYYNEELHLTFSYDSPMEVTLPSEFKYGKDFTILVSGVPGADIKVTLYDKNGVPTKNWWGKPPTIFITKPNVQGDATLEVTAYMPSGIEYTERFDITFSPVNFKVMYPYPYEYPVGENFEITILIEGEELPGYPMRIEVKKPDGTVSGSWEGSTPTVMVTSPKVIGHATIVVTVEYQDITLSDSQSVFFSGSPYIVEPEIENFVQYSDKPVKFNLIIRDVTGKPVSPSQLGDYSVTATLSNGQVSQPIPVEYIGNGRYQVVMLVDGEGELKAVFHYTYNDQQFESKEIKLQIDPSTISINTNDITPVATVGETVTIRIEVFDSQGQPFSPSRLWAEIRRPNGVTIDTIEKKDFREIDTGVYTFDYKFTDVEKYTITFHAEDFDIEPGVATASIAVGEPPGYGTGPGPSFLGMFVENITFILAFFFVVMLIVTLVLVRKRLMG